MPSDFSLSNTYLTDDDHMYHLGILTNDDIIKRMHDVKFVVIGGKASRMKRFAYLLYEALGRPVNSELESNSNGVVALKDITKHAGRYTMFKVGPCLCGDHGIGAGSTSILLHEMFKLIHYSKAQDVKVIRVGSSGGLGVEPGTIVVTQQAYSSALEPFFTQVACGMNKRYESKTDRDLSQKLFNLAEDLKMPVTIGNTISTNDYFEEQARLDGALCSYTKEDKMLFLKKAYDECGVRNFEMESLVMAASCSRVNMKCAVVCVAYLDRFKGDYVTTDAKQIQQWEENILQLVCNFVKLSS